MPRRMSYNGQHLAHVPVNIGIMVRVVGIIVTGRLISPLLSAEDLILGLE